MVQHDKLPITNSEPQSGQIELSCKKSKHPAWWWTAHDLQTLAERAEDDAEFRYLAQALELADAKLKAGQFGRQLQMNGINTYENNTGNPAVRLFYAEVELKQYIFVV